MYVNRVHRPRFFCGTGRLALLALLACARVGAAADLDDPCPVAWRGEPLADAARELADRYALTCVFDTSVSTETKRERVRMEAAHLTGRQALRWLARWADLEAVILGATVFLAPPDRLPRIWRLRADRNATERADRRIEELPARTGTVAWIDAPLSLVARDVSAVFGVDMIFHRRLVASQKTVYLPEVSDTLASVCEKLAELLEASYTCLDGAIWVYPAAARTRPAASAPAGSPVAASAVPTTAEVLLADPLVVARPVEGWEALAARITAQTGLACLVEPPAADPPPAFEAAGPAHTVLEAAALLGLFTYQVEPARPDAPAGIVLRPGSAR